MLEILYKYGFGYTWLMQDVGNKHIFLSAFKQRVNDCFQQEWHGKTDLSNSLEFYSTLKSVLDIFL